MMTWSWPQQELFSSTIPPKSCSLCSIFDKAAMYLFLNKEKNRNDTASAGLQFIHSILVILRNCCMGEWDWVCKPNWCSWYVDWQLSTIIMLLLFLSSNDVFSLQVKVEYKVKQDEHRDIKTSTLHSNKKWKWTLQGSTNLI